MMQGLNPIVLRWLIALSICLAGNCYTAFAGENTTKCIPKKILKYKNDTEILRSFCVPQVYFLPGVSLPQSTSLLFSALWPSLLGPFDATLKGNSKKQESERIIVIIMNSPFVAPSIQERRNGVLKLLGTTKEIKPNSDITIILPSDSPYEDGNGVGRMYVFESERNDYAFCSALGKGQPFQGECKYFFDSDGIQYEVSFGESLIKEYASIRSKNNRTHPPYVLGRKKMSMDLVYLGQLWQLVE